MTVSPPPLVPSATDGPAPIVTAGGFLRDGGRVLVERRRADATTYPGRIDSPGGHVEPGETPERALVRELREELGVEVEVFALLAVVDDLEERSGRLYRHFVYVVERWRGDVRAAEGQDVFWLEPSRAGDVGPWNPIARWTLSLLSRETLDLLVQRTRAGRADAGGESARGKAP